MQGAQVAYETARQAEVTGIQLAEQQLAGSQAGFDKLRAGADANDLAAARAHAASSRATLDKLGGEQRSGALGAAQALLEEAQANLDRLRAGHPNAISRLLAPRCGAPRPPSSSRRSRWTKPSCGRHSAG